jgi:hypothetical protein
MPTGAGREVVSDTSVTRPGAGPDAGNDLPAVNATGVNAGSCPVLAVRVNLPAGLHDRRRLDSTS